MQKPHKDLLRTLVAGLRHTLLGRYDDASVFYPGDLDRELERLGVGRDGRITPLDALPYATFHERRAHRVAEAQLADVPAAQRPVVCQEIVERAAYTWINRLLALRAMEARGLIDETLRPNPAYDGIPEALFILRHTAPERTAGADGGWWAVIEDACHAQAASLPGLFDLDDPNAALRPSTAALVKCVGLVGGGVDKETSRQVDKEASRQGAEGNGLDGVFRDPDAIGWAYQFYQEEAKARTYAKLGRGGKVETRGEIAAVTQLFTEPYMVQWLLQNSLGRSYHELYPDSRLPETWAYYIRRPEDQRSEGQKSEGQATDHRSPYTDHRSPFTSLADLTFMDPCMGGGHLEREAFDMLAAMYREQQPEMDATAIADRILSHHLHGIDIDPRAAQLAGLTLYLRGWELVRDERRQRGLAGPGEYRPPCLNLATTPTHLTPGALQRHLQRHPEDRPFEPLLRGVFEALEQAPILGSLLKPGEHLDQALAAYRKPHSGVQMGLLDESASLNRLLEELARHDPDELKRVLLERISRSFAAEAEDADDVGAALFGREASEGMRLLQLLERKYVVVATNPPYLSSGNIQGSLKTCLTNSYETGKRDLYTAFILRCRDLSKPGGRVAMVTMHSWLFLQSFSWFRAVPDHALLEHKQAGRFSGMLRATSIEMIGHLGAKAFEEISGEVVQSVLFTFRNRIPNRDHRLTAFRLTGIGSVDGKKAGLANPDLAYSRRQSSFIDIAESRIAYWIDDSVLDMFRELPKLAEHAFVLAGLKTAYNELLVRCFWEVLDLERWKLYAKGGGYSRWAGQIWLCVNWHQNLEVYRDLVSARYPHHEMYGVPGFTFSNTTRGLLGVRKLESGTIFGNSGPGVFPDQGHTYLVALLNTRLYNYLARCLTSSLYIAIEQVADLPILRLSESEKTLLEDCVEWCISACRILASSSVTEATFDPKLVGLEHHVAAMTMLSVLEAAIERVALQVSGLSDEVVSQIMADTGSPAGWHPLVAQYTDSPLVSSGLRLPQMPPPVLDLLANHERIHPDPTELARIKANLRTLYEAGPGVNTEDADLEDLEHQGDEDETVSGAYIPIPTETFLEELSVKLHIHPISVYWLLEELRAEGVRCKPEERRLLEDRLSVLALRLLGHRWPRQLEAGEPVPPWADRDGIIPLTPGCGEPTVAERLRERLRAEDGPLGAQRVEALLEELTGQTLETWLRKTFFERHTRQFKRRPIAWQLASTPVAGAKGKGGKKGKREPAFECLLYYHACGGDVLARIRTQYVEPLLIAERRRVDQARKAGDDSAAALATARIHELEDFAGRLRQVEESGFACPALDDFVAEEPLDRWSGDGVFPPVNREALLAQERAWRVDINDGVRVNVAPLQAAGLLAGDVLNKKDLPKAIADRARWRSDERRWVRAGKLPRCGWMDESIPESPAWTDLAPEREAERVRLEEKRKTALAQTSAELTCRPSDTES